MVSSAEGQEWETHVYAAHSTLGQSYEHPFSRCRGQLCLLCYKWAAGYGHSYLSSPVLALVKFFLLEDSQRILFLFLLLCALQQVTSVLQVVAK